MIKNHDQKGKLIYPGPTEASEYGVGNTKDIAGWSIKPIAMSYELLIRNVVPSSIYRKQTIIPRVPKVFQNPGQNCAISSIRFLNRFVLLIKTIYDLTSIFFRSAYTINANMMKNAITEAK